LSPARLVSRELDDVILRKNYNQIVGLRTRFSAYRGWSKKIRIFYSFIASPGAAPPHKESATPPSCGHGFAGGS
jgi:hypothetical protein